MHYYNEEITNNITQEISSRFNIRSINELSKSIDTEILTNIFKNTDTNEK
jgi:hypothetical protein